MSLECVQCCDTLTKSDSMMCSICNNVAHYYCVGYTETNFIRMTNNTKTKFTCSNCSKTNLKSPKSKSNEPVSQHHKSVGKNVEELIKSVSFLSSQFDNFSEKIDSVIIELKTIKLENEKIVNENKRLSEEVSILKHKIDAIEQHNLGITVELTGIPKTQNEDCISIIDEIGKKTNTELNIIEAYRINSTMSKQNIIVARLTSLEMRKNLIRNVKSLKVTTDMINSKWPKEKVFINERLTKFKRMLFSQTRLAAKSKQYKFIWLSNSYILVRKIENSNIVKIGSPEDVDKL